MRYFKVKKYVDKYTTKSIVNDNDHQCYRYDIIENYEYFGVDIDSSDANFLTKQHPECEVEELTYEQIKPILDNCRFKKELEDHIRRGAMTREEADDHAVLMGLIKPGF